MDGPMDQQVDGVKVETKRPGLKTPAEVSLHSVLVYPPLPGGVLLRQ